MRLTHLHIPRPIPYTRSLQLQEALLEKHFAYKTYIRSSSKSTPASPVPLHPPNPTLLTFQTHPTYTVGRRHLNANPLSPAQIEYLTTNTENPVLSHQQQQLYHQNAIAKSRQLATFFPSPRGGLLTYHAPGQLTAYLILNLRTHHLTPRCYIRTLENTVIRTCARHGVPNTATTDDPGVWVTEHPNLQVINGPPQVGGGGAAGGQACAVVNTNSAATTDDQDAVEEAKQEEKQSQPQSQSQNLRPTDRKICAIGVQVSRGITSHGIGLNVFDSPLISDSDGTSIPPGLYTLPSAAGAAGADGALAAESVYTRTSTQLDHYAKQQQIHETANRTARPAPGCLSWGFSRIVACGLEGKSVTWLSREQQQQQQQREARSLSIDEVAHSLAIETCRSLGLDERDVERTTEEEILS